MLATATPVSAAWLPPTCMSRLSSDWAKTSATTKPDAPEEFLAPPQADFAAPCWQNYRSLLQHLFPDSSREIEVPGCEVLNQVLAERITRHSGKAIRFVPAGQLPAAAYEEHIYRTGEISTRQDNWHDVFNALAWASFPRTKSALNARHYEEIRHGHARNRGPVRDALTLLDECGVIVVGDHEPALQALAERNWQALFRDYRLVWQQHLRVFVLGHALLEKFLHPYKAITAQVLVFRSGSNFCQQDGEAQTSQVDGILSGDIETGSRLHSSAELSPLPLMGIPGWWPQGQQDAGFYADANVFRKPHTGFSPAIIHTLEKD